MVEPKPFNNKVQDTIQIFIGCAANTEDAESQAVIDYTLHKYASKRLDITWMKLSRDPDSRFYSDPEQGLGWRTENWATPFSGFRWAIPTFCGFKGKAIYMDSDTIARADIAELWNQKFRPGKIVLAKGEATSNRRLCVSLWDCEAAREWMMPLAQLMKNPDSHRIMGRKMSRNAFVIQKFIGNWNCLDGERYESLDDPDIKCIHYTSMRHQLQIRHALKRLERKGIRHWFDGDPTAHWRKELSDLFDKLLFEAEAKGYLVSNYEQSELYGPYRKKSVAGQGKTIPHWATQLAR